MIAFIVVAILGQKSLATNARFKLYIRDTFIVILYSTVNRLARFRGWSTSHPHAKDVIRKQLQRTPRGWAKQVDSPALNDEAGDFELIVSTSVRMEMIIPSRAFTSTIFECVFSIAARYWIAVLFVLMTTGSFRRSVH